MQVDNKRALVVFQKRLKDVLIHIEYGCADHRHTDGYHWIVTNIFFSFAPFEAPRILS